MAQQGNITCDPLDPLEGGPMEPHQIDRDQFCAKHLLMIHQVCLRKTRRRAAVIESPILRVLCCLWDALS